MRSVWMVSLASKLNATHWLDSQYNRISRSWAIACSRPPDTSAPQGNEPVRSRCSSWLRVLVGRSVTLSAIKEEVTFVHRAPEHTIRQGQEDCACLIRAQQARARRPDSQAREDVLIVRGPRQDLTTRSFRADLESRVISFWK